MWHAFFDFRDRCRLMDINVPIIAGIMPVSSISSMNRMAELSAGTNFPARLLKAMLRAGGDKASIERIGINYASNQCSELLDAEVDGLHFYTLNRSKATLEIYHNLGFNNYFSLERLRPTLRPCQQLRKTLRLNNIRRCLPDPRSLRLPL